MAGRASRSLAVSVCDVRGRRMLAGGLGGWLTRAAPASARGVVSIALVSDAAMRRLNRTYRGKDYATDVLSFEEEHYRPRGSKRPRDTRRPPRSTPRVPLGDIAIAMGVARRQAREQGHSLATELRVLALHGLLHLLGYDHDRDRGEMGRVEERLRRRAGLRAGLIARDARAFRR
jgi:probable rRNA maturation factor